MTLATKYNSLEYHIILDLNNQKIVYLDCKMLVMRSKGE